MLNTSNLHPQYLTDEHGKKVAVVLSMEQFQGLIDDIEDLASIAERRNESTVSHEELIKELKNNGLLSALPARSANYQSGAQKKYLS